MPSNARNTLDANKADLDRLWWFHSNEAGNTQGRKYGVEVLNKAVVVFVCAAWEAFCEDIILEAVAHIKADGTDFNLLPKEVKTPIALRIKEEKHEQSPWKLAGDGWKDVVVAHAKECVAALNTPKSGKLKTLFAETIGIKDITHNWNWQNCTVATAISRLDDFVTLRGELAHRLKATTAVKKKHGEDFFSHAKMLAEKIDLTVRNHLHTLTGNHYW
jgi:hypothetical protein